MEIGILTEADSGLSPKRAQELGVYLWNPLQEGLKEALAHLLPLYDRVLLLLSQPPIGRHLHLAQALAAENPRLLVYATPFFSAGLALLAEAASLLAKRVEPREMPQALKALEERGRLFLASHNPERLSAQGWLPPGGRAVLGVGFWALYTLEGERIKLPPLPVPQGQLPQTLARFLAQASRGQPLGVRLHLGAKTPSEWRRGLAEAIRKATPVADLFLAPLEKATEEVLGPEGLVAAALPLPG